MFHILIIHKLLLTYGLFGIIFKIIRYLLADGFDQVLESEDSLLLSHGQSPVSHGMVVDDGRRDVAVEAVIACLKIAVLHHARQNAHPEMVVSQMSWLEKERYRRAQCCYVRHSRFKEGRNKVRDHCHGTGRYRGAACQECNLKMKQPKDVKVLAHNMSKFDGHILLQAIARMRHDEEWKDRPVYQSRGKWVLLKDLRFSMIKISNEHGKCFRFGPLTFVDMQNSRGHVNTSVYTDEQLFAKGVCEEASVDCHVVNYGTDPEKPQQGLHDALPLRRGQEVLPGAPR
jgi:hypothetical protein